MNIEEIKIYCSYCKEQMADKGNYVHCNSGKCTMAVSTHAIPINQASLYKYQLSGTIIIK